MLSDHVSMSLLGYTSQVDNFVGPPFNCTMLHFDGNMLTQHSKVYQTKMVPSPTDATLLSRCAIVLSWDLHKVT